MSNAEHHRLKPVPPGGTGFSLWNKNRIICLLISGAKGPPCCCALVAKAGFRGDADVTRWQEPRAATAIRAGPSGRWRVRSAAYAHRPACRSSRTCASSSSSAARSRSRSSAGVSSNCGAGGRLALAARHVLLAGRYAAGDVFQIAEHSHHNGERRDTQQRQADRELAYRQNIDVAPLMALGWIVRIKALRFRRAMGIRFIRGHDSAPPPDWVRATASTVSSLVG